jgi:hypothetical protein
MYKPGFPEMDNIFLKFIYFILLTFELFFILTQNYTEALLSSFLPKNFILVLDDVSFETF